MAQKLLNQKIRLGRPKMIDPSHTYIKKYGTLRSMSGPDGLKYVFGNGVAAHNKPLVTRAPKMVLPGIASFDPRCMNFQAKLSFELNEACPVNLNNDLFALNGVHTSFDRLRTLAGYMMNPMSYTMLDNKDYRISLGLKSGYTARQRTIAENVWTLIFSAYSPASVKITKKSTSGQRRNTSDHVWKHDFALFVYESDHFEQILQAVEAKDWLKLADTFEIVFAMYIQKRDQVDTPGKERLVFDLEYILSGGKSGNEFNADKKVVVDGKEWSEFSATRARVVHAGPWAINCLLSIISSGTMLSLFERFPSVFHVNTAEEIENVVNGNYVWAGDVKEYDRSMDKEAISVAHEMAKKFWDPRFVSISEMLYFSPYYARPLDMNGTRGTWVGDPRNLEPQVMAGNRSGHAWTSLMAKGNKVIETLFIFDAMGLEVLGNERLYLEGKGSIGIINNGDDEIIYTKNPGILDLFKAKRADLDAGHYVVTREEGAVFSGNLLIPDKYDSLKYHATPRLHTGFEKIYVPERSIGGNFRPFWYIGVLERINNRARHPLGELAWEVHDRLFHDMLAPHFGTLHSMIVDAEQKAPFSYGALTVADREVLEDPSKLHYKFLDSEVSDEVLELVVSKIPFEKFEHLVKRYFTGSIQ